MGYVLLKLVDGSRTEEQFCCADGALYQVGRGEDCQIRLPNRSVSRRHCQLAIAFPNIWVEDLGSRNGTFVNGRRIGERIAQQVFGKGRGTCHVLRDGDELRVSGASLRVALKPSLARRHRERRSSLAR
jgi:eukaryotic-like serine/threonine-protein kinase